MLVLKYGTYLNKKALIKNVLPIASRSYCDWAHKWKFGKYPETKEEREAAAAKYNLIPEDYEPIGRESGLGDYPHIERLSHQQEARPYYLDYDEPYWRRNYGETLSEHFVAQQFEPPDNITGYSREFKICMSILFGLFALIVIGILGPEKVIREVKPKQYPPQYFPGVRPKTHYTFESN